jgi:ankyrin repeat protein
VAQVRKLLLEGAKPDDSAAGRSPLIQALTLPNGKALQCNLPILRLLLQYGADPNRADPRIGSLPLLTAFAVGNVPCAAALRQAGAPANSRDAGGYTILHSAVGAATRSGDASIIDVAMKWGININIQSDDGYTALHEAVRIMSIPLIKALLLRGADACIKNKLAQTPLEMAINLRRDPELIAVLRSAQCASGR